MAVIIIVSVIIVTLAVTCVFFCICRDGANREKAFLESLNRGSEKEGE